MKLTEQNSQMLLLLSQAMTKKRKSRNTPDGDVYLTAAEAQIMLGVCNKTLNRYRNNHKIVATSPYPRNYRYSQNSIIAFLTTSLKKTT